MQALLSAEGLDPIKDASYSELAVGKRERVARQSNSARLYAVGSTQSFRVFPALQLATK